MDTLVRRVGVSRSMFVTAVAATFLVSGFFMAPARAATAGDATITQFMANPSGTETDREWIEIKNNTSGDLNVSGWVINTGSDHTITGTYSIPAGSKAVICRNSDITLNGGVNCNYTALVPLSNSGTTISLTDGVNPIDAVTYTAGDIVSGKSTLVAGGHVLSVYSGALTLASGDNAAPAGNTVTINNKSYPDILSAVTAAIDGDTINIGAGTYELNSQIRISNQLTIIGAGDSTVITKGSAAWTNSSGSKGDAPLITVSAGDKAVVLRNFKVTGAATILMTPSCSTPSCKDYGHGINVVSSSNVTLDNVTSAANAAAGLIVNSSTVTANDLNTNNNGWYGVNVDKNTTGDANFTLTGSGVLSEDIQIKSDKTVGSTVTASGYTPYAIGSTTETRWTNKPLARFATIGSTAYSTIQAAVNAALKGDTVNIGAGTFREQLSITKNLTLTGVGASTIIQAPAVLTADSFGKKVIVETASSSTVSISNLTVTGPGPSGCANIDYGIFAVGGSSLNISNSSVTDIQDTPLSGCQNGGGIRAGSQDLGQVGHATINNVVISGYQKGGIVIDGTGSTGTITGSTVTGIGPTATIAQNGVQFSRGATGSVTGSTIAGNYWTGKYRGSNDPISDPNADGSAGILLYQSGSGVSVTNNTLSGNQFGIWSVEANGSVTITDNTIQGAADTGSAKVTALALWNTQYGDPIVNPSATVGNNIITDSTYGVLASVSPSLTITNNSFSTRGFSVFTKALVNAANNWWGTASPSFSTILSGNVSYAPWYINPGRTVSLNEVTDGKVDATTDNFDLGSNTSGEADMPKGVTDVVLSNDTKLDLSGGVSSASAETVTVGDVTVNVGESVKLNSGVDGEPMVLTNSDVSNASLVIDDNTTVKAPAAWDGKITPPTAGTSDGTSPSGFSVGSTKIEVGSPLGVLLFDKPVSVILKGVTGSVGYRPAGSSVWVTITNKCGGSYDSPADPGYPKECYVSNGSDTKIYTYHLTTFAALVSDTGSGGGGGGGGGGAVFIPSSTPAPVSAPVVVVAGTPAPQPQVAGAITTRAPENVSLSKSGQYYKVGSNVFDASGKSVSLSEFHQLGLNLALLPGKSAVRSNVALRPAPQAVALKPKATANPSVSPAAEEGNPLTAVIGGAVKATPKVSATPTPSPTPAAKQGLMQKFFGWLFGKK